jgi:predicted phage terminase large subunit-like protein
LQAIDTHLRRVALGDITRLMVFVPPQEGKSTRTAGWYPLWRLSADPSLRIAIVSYNQGKALRWGRWLRRMIRMHPELGIELQDDSQAADRFETTAGGLVISVGIEGGITGEAVDELIIDDPVRGRAEAESATYRDHAWEWWESNAMTRASARFRVILMMTRFHADDLAGRLLREEPGEWTMLRIPALREEGTPIVRGDDGASVYNPDGELISVQGRPAGWFKHLAEIRSTYVWRSVYQQTPVRSEGNLFRKTDFCYWQPLARDPTRHDSLAGRRVHAAGSPRYVTDLHRFLTVDLAASVKSSADWTVAAVWGISGDGHLILLDRVRDRAEETGHWDLVRPLVQRWDAPTVYVERGFIGSTLVIDATRNGIHVEPVSPDRDKITRAVPAANLVRQQRVWFPADADWLGDWIAELAEFPAGAHDDQVDVLSYAVRILYAHWSVPYSRPAVRADGRVSAAEQAYRAGTGTTTTPDLATAAW